MEFIDPADLPDPDELAIGGWTCPCGRLTFSGMRGTPGVSFRPTCIECGTTAEILAEALA